jgi:RNA polymerase sigma-70 factor (ECF subfamily)
MSVAEEIRFGRSDRGRNDPARLVSSLFVEHRHRIYRLCLALLRSPQDAEDAVQQTFVNALRAVESGVLPRCEAAWLAEIARNVCRERHRVAARRARLETVTSPDDLGELPAKATAAPDDVGDLRGALRRLDARQRTALVLREWRGLSYREIGGMLQLSEGAAEALVSRARRSLVRTVESGTRVGPCLNLVGLAAMVRRWLAGGTAKAAAVVACGVTIVTAPVLEQKIEHRFTKPGAAPERVEQARPAAHRARASVAGEASHGSSVRAHVSATKDNPGTTARVDVAGGAPPPVAPDPRNDGGPPGGKAPTVAGGSAPAGAPGSTAAAATAGPSVGVGAGGHPVIADVSVGTSEGEVTATTSVRAGEGGVGATTTVSTGADEITASADTGKDGIAASATVGSERGELGATATVDQSGADVSAAGTDASVAVAGHAGGSTVDLGTR